MELPSLTQLIALKLTKPVNGNKDGKKIVKDGNKMNATTTFTSLMLVNTLQEMPSLNLTLSLKEKLSFLNNTSLLASKLLNTTLPTLLATKPRLFTVKKLSQSTENLLIKSSRHSKPAPLKPTISKVREAQFATTTNTK